MQLAPLKNCKKVTGTKNEISEMNDSDFDAFMHAIADEAVIEEMVV